jgi:hypothetical protein
MVPDREIPENRIVVTSDDHRHVLGRDPVRIQVVIAPEKRPILKKALPRAARPGLDSLAVLLNIEDVRSSGSPGVVFRIFLDDFDATARTNPSESNYAGSIAIYRVPTAGGETFSFEISRLIREMAGRGQWDPDRVNVSIVAAGVGNDDEPKSEVTFGRVSISIDE